MAAIISITVGRSWPVYLTLFYQNLPAVSGFLKEPGSFSLDLYSNLMTIAGTLYHRFKRHRSLQTSVIKAMPLVVLMPHSGCNCRCVMCDIWKDNQQRQQLTANDISELLVSLKKLGTQQVLMSGGRSLLHPAFFQLCDILRQEQISVVLLSTGLTLKSMPSY